MIPVRVTREFMYLRRSVLVAVSLADLRGPTSGVVELPLHLFWSGGDTRDSRFSLDDPAGRRQVYRTVLREARSPDDLAAFLDGGMLTALWARLVLPRSVREAWAGQHPALRRHPDYATRCRQAAAARPAPARRASGAGLAAGSGSGLPAR
jgi:hypothetical protein